MKFEAATIVSNGGGLTFCSLAMAEAAAVAFRREDSRARAAEHSQRQTQRSSMCPIIAPADPASARRRNKKKRTAMNDSFISKQGFRELVANAFHIYFKNAPTFIAICAAILLPGYLLIDTVSYFAPDSENAVQAFDLILTSFLQLVAQLFLVGEISQACFGQPTSVGRSLTRASARGLGRLIGTNLLAMGVIVLVVLGIVCAGVLLVLADYTWVGVLAFGLACVAFVLLWVRYIFVSQVVILQRVYWVSALRASASLVTGSFWKTLWYGIVFGLAVAFLSYLVTAIPLSPLPEEFPGHWLVESIVSNAVALLLFVPISAAFWTLFYYSLRIESDRLTTADLVEIQSFGNL
jgi:hypothetical protein